MGGFVRQVEYIHMFLIDFVPKKTDNNIGHTRRTRKSLNLSHCFLVLVSLDYRGDLEESSFRLHLRRWRRMGKKWFVSTFQAESVFAESRDATAAKRFGVSICRQPDRRTR